MPIDSSAYIRSEVLAVTNSTRGKLQILLDNGVSLPNRPRDGTLHRWPRDEIMLASVALKLSRMGLLLAAIRPAIEAARRELQAGPLAVLMVEFDDAAGRFKAATRLDGVAPLGDLAEPSEVTAGAGVRLLIDVAAETRSIAAKLQAHRADHGVAQRGPKACRKAA
jgi:hypothetical protein